MVWDDHARGKTGVVVSGTVVIVSAICRAGTIVVAAHVRDRGGVHTPLNHGRRAGSERAMIVGEHQGFVVKHPGLTSENVRIKGVVTLSLFQTALHG